ncbi:hypothetical protein KI387_012294, partial [Taxus chinensis]
IEKRTLYGGREDKEWWLKENGKGMLERKKGKNEALKQGLDRNRGMVVVGGNGGLKFQLDGRRGMVVGGKLREEEFGMVVIWEEMKRE